MLEEPEIRRDNYWLHYLRLQTLTETASVAVEHILERHNRSSPKVQPPQMPIVVNLALTIRKRAQNTAYHLSWAERTYREHTAAA